MSCFEEEQLEAYVEQALDEAQTAALLTHTDTCSECAERLAEIRDNLRIVRPVEMAFDRQTEQSQPGPSRIGPFRIEGVLGRGGMGTVYEARQDYPDRVVALKIIKPSQLSSGALRRFQHEAQVLGRLQHAGIAQVFEASTADWGEGPQPYLAMELVRGTSIQAYVRNHGLAFGAILELIVKVCDAVHHAHRNGVIHRDLKPSNIIVDESGQPKILDFGVARLAGNDSPITSVHTDVRQLIGTLPYMSPEQVSGDQDLVDYRSDVYAIGVILYELLAGRLPYDLTNRSLADAASMIQEQDPDRLSTANRSFRGDIDNIMIKSLEKEPSRRYQTAAALADDIRRYLAHEPIEARPQSTIYLLGKFARRHRAFVAGCLAVLIVLAGGVVVSTSQAVRATNNEARARVQADRARAVSEFLQEMLASVDPSHDGGNKDVTVREVLDRAGVKLDQEGIVGHAETEAALRNTIGNTYRSLGYFDSAEPHLTKAVEIGRMLAPSGSEQLADSLNKLGRLRQAQGEFDDAASLFRQSLDMRRMLLGPEHRDVATMLNNLAWLQTEQGLYEEALGLHQQALRIRRAALGNEHVEVASSMHNLAVVHYYQGAFDEAEPLLRESLAMDRKLRGDHPNVATTMSTLGLVLKQTGRTDEAETLLRDSLEMRRRLEGDEHPLVATALNNLAVLLKEVGRLDEAELLFREALVMGKKIYGHNHVRNAQGLNNLGALMMAKGEPRAAEALHRDALETFQRELSKSHPSVLITKYHLANCWIELGQPQDAANLMAATVADARSALPQDHWNIGVYLRTQGRALAALRRISEAEETLLESHRILDLSLGAKHHSTQVTRAELASLYEQAGRHEDAAKWRSARQSPAPHPEPSPQP